MSRRLAEPLSIEVTGPQHRAADPDTSAWVRANAGSGKTHVLTERVMRLLLAGVAPEQILCLTYTKAAAAEMRRRVAARLAAWAVLPDEALAKSLAALENRPADPATLARARTLFAHALDTPGGLKINTIHAFCESVLHRFPLEAGVPFDFTVVEEVEAASLIRRTREAVIAEGLRGTSEIASAVETLFRLLSDHSMTLAIDAALGQGRKLRRVLADRTAAKAQLRRLVAHPAAESRAEILRRAVEEMLFPPTLHDELFAHLPPDPARSKNLRFIDKLWQARAQMGDGEVRFEIFLKDDGGGYSDRRTGRITDPTLAAAVGAEHDRLAGLYPAFRRATLVERSEALLDLLGTIVARYEAQKRARSWLDFDDLIEKLGDLFARSETADWVRYKLDAGIGHILVDESQDTNPEQWRVVRALASEFFVGDSAVERPRTLFAVGDEKQSIFSFQGAEPKLFGSEGRAFRAAAIEVERRFADVPLHTSFRSLPAVLAAVDRVFARPDLATALLADEAVEHKTARAEAGGTVTLWPPLQDVADAVDPERWPVEPVSRLQRAPRRLAERIAGEIRRWLDDRRPLGPRGRPVRAEDVLILVQSRSALFTELIRALSGRGIPTPGADRLPVTTHIAVLDLLALGDVLTNPADSLQLAALLRSPLFDVTEDELYAIAAGRPHGQTLWRALEASELPSAREAFARLHRWRGRLDFGRPFEFYAEVLYRDEGLKRLHGRLGGEVDDVLVEFLELALAHEQTASPSMHGFIAEMRAQDVSIKRDLAEPGSGVRVMTVHGAKGLEAPIVILADAASRAGAALLPPVFIGDEPLLVHAPSKAVHTPETLKLRDKAVAADEQEYWRKLYVGMTRAEDELYVTGLLTQRGRLDGSWYEAVEAALAPAAERREDADGSLRELVFPAGRPAPAPIEPSPVETPPGAAPLLLPPLRRPVPVAVVTPSSAYEGREPERALDTTAEAAGDAEAARKSGLALHALLQHLGRVAPADRQRVAAKAIAVLLPETPERHSALAHQALSILGNPAFAELFGPDSRAELPFLMQATRNGAPVRLAGRIDRLVVASGRVLVVDYKSDATPAGTVSEVPASYLTQVGLYALVAGQLFPGLAVQAGILWTSLESLMILPPPVLRGAVSAFTMR